MDPQVRQALTFCNTPCIPLNTSVENQALIKSAIQRIKLPPEHNGLREYLHIFRNDQKELADAVKALDGVNSLKEFDAFMDNRLITAIKDATGVTIRKGKDGLWEFPRTDGAVVREFEIGKHSYLNGNRGTENFFQSHHGIQDAWAKQRFQGLSVYSREEAPTLLLRSRNIERGSRGTPHGLIRDLQIARGEGSFATRTFADELEALSSDLKIIGAPPNVQTEYLSAVEKYFKGLYDQLSVKMNKTELKNIFGNWPK